MKRGYCILLAGLMALTMTTVAIGQTFGGRQIFGGKRNASQPASANQLILPESTVFWVQLQKPFLIAKAKKGDTFEVDILTINPEKKTSSLPIRSNADPGVPKGSTLKAQVVTIHDAKDRHGKTFREVEIIFDALIGADGKTRPFLGAISNSGSENLPRWLEQRRYDAKDRASNAESMAVVLPWAADLGPIGILAAVVGTRIFQKNAAKRGALRTATAMAIGIISGDLVEAKNKDGEMEMPCFYVISTMETRY